MRILYLVGNCYDFGVDFLYDGLMQLDHEVIEWPAQDHYHREGEDGAHWREWACEFTHPHHGWTEERITETLRAGRFDLVVLTTLRGDAPNTVKRLIPHAPPGQRMAALDMMDEPEGRATREAALGRPVEAFFLRECPPTPEPGTLPLSFSFPRRWAVRPSKDRAPRVIFHAASIAGRDHIMTTVRAAVPPESCDVSITGWMQRTYPFAVYLERLRTATVAVVAPGGGWDTNRLWEAAASGCALVMPRPPIRMAHPFTDRQAAFYEGHEDCARVVRRLLDDPAEAYELARASSAHFLTFHTTQMRARQFLEGCGF